MSDKKKKNRLKGMQSGYPTGGGPAGITPEMMAAMQGGMGAMYGGPSGEVPNG
jgi:hypothetical protein